MFWILSSCDLDADSTDFCEDSKMATPVSVSFRATVTAGYADGSPVDGVPAKLLVYKIPCGEDRKGEFPTSVSFYNGMFESGIATYNIRYRNDAIVAHLTINDGANNISEYKQINGDAVENMNGQTRLINFVLTDLQH